MSNDTAGLLICDVGHDGGMWLPLFGQSEQDWPGALRAILYFVGILWFFMGVAIVADIFMLAIETITSVQRRVEIDGKSFHVNVWNGTIANLTLMALGSSAPEILLNVIEILGNDYFAGDLGPSTIVGSAAFNLLVISAVCVWAIPTKEKDPKGTGTRFIKDLTVFYITAFFSVFAYVWLLVILLMWTPDFITPIEAAITFALFPFLVTIAYFADAKKACFAQAKVSPTSAHITGFIGADGKPMTRDELAMLVNEVKKENGAHIDDDTAMKLAAHKARNEAPKSRAHHRVNATRKITGGQKIKARDDPKSPEITASVGDVEAPPTGPAGATSGVRFSATSLAVLESMKKVKLSVIADGETKVTYETVEGTAKAGEDFVATSGELTFTSGGAPQSVEVAIQDDAKYENDKDFKVVLKSATSDVPMGEGSVATITIINDDKPAMLRFSSDDYSCMEKDGQAVLKVERHGNPAGEVSCRVATEDSTARAPKDYASQDYTLTFADGETEKAVVVPVVDDDAYEKDEQFRVRLTDASGATFDQNTDGGADCCIAVVTIKSDDKTKNVVDLVLKAGLGIDGDKMSIGASSYAAQFQEALAGPDADGDGKVSLAERISHLLNLPWKLVFAFIPPPIFMGGWLCFFVALAFIGAVTILIGDIAALLGCVIGMPDSTTAITIVALGTSMPDTLASMSAAVQDRYADASIGNITGSNSVNVFLGLGLPWLIGALYWSGTSPETTQGLAWTAKYKTSSKIAAESFDSIGAGQIEFAVPAGSLGSSVMIFCACALICLGTLCYRRKSLGAELGGEGKTNTALFFCALWAIYIAGSILTT